MDNVLSTLGLIYRARKLVLGEECLNHINDVKYMFIASDASDKTKERFIKKCDYYNIPCNNSYSYVDLSRALGKGNVKVIGITDIGFSRSIQNKVK